MAGENSAIENRLYKLELKVEQLFRLLDGVANTAGKALQDAGITQGGGGGGGGGATALGYTTSAVTARVGSTFGQGSFEFILGVGNPQVGTTTGDSGDGSQAGWNITGGAAPSGAFCILAQTSGNPKWYYIVLDCFSATVPGAPAVAMGVGSGAGALGGAAVPAGISVGVGSGSGTLSGFAVPEGGTSLGISAPEGPGVMTL